MVERFFLHDGTIKSMQIRSLVFTLANYLYQLPEIFGMNISDIADTESVGLRNLSWIDDKSTFFQLCVESFEVEIGIRIEERSNNGRLNLVRQQRLETEGTHAVHQHAVVLAISVVTGPTPPSSASSSMACLKARTTCVGEVKRHLPCPFSMASHWS